MRAASSSTLRMVTRSCWKLPSLTGGSDRMKWFETPPSVRRLLNMEKLPARDLRVDEVRVQLVKARHGEGRDDQEPKHRLHHLEEGTVRGPELHIRCIQYSRGQSGSGF